MPASRAELQTDARGRDVLVVAGDIDLANAHDLVTTATPLLSRQQEHALVLDLAGVTFLDSTGIGALLEIRTLALAEGRRTEVVAMSEAVERVLELAGLTDLFAPEEDPA